MTNPYAQKSYNDLGEGALRRNPNSRSVVAPNRTQLHQTNQHVTKLMRSDAPPAKKQKLETRSMTASHKTPSTGKSRRQTTWGSTGSTLSTSMLEDAYPITVGSQRQSTNGHVHTSKSTISVLDDPLRLSTPTTRPAVIDLAQEEDLGVPVSSSYAISMPQTPSTSSDDMQLIATNGNSDHSNSAPDSIGKILGVSKPSDEHAFGGSLPTHDIKPPPSAGPHTRALKAQLIDPGHIKNGIGDGEMDPIEDPDEFDSIPRERDPPERKATSSVPENVVKKNIVFYESKVRPPELDLTVIRRKKVPAMKTKVRHISMFSIHA